jgi:hypothetical protein
MSTDDIPEFDPFERHLRFAGSTAAGGLPRAAGEPAITPIAPLDTGLDKLVDLDALERLQGWKGALLPPTPMADDKYPDDLVDRLKEREPPFVLRNLPRVERLVDPDAKLETERIAVTMGLAAAGDRPVVRVDPPELLGATSLDAVRERHSFLRWYMRGIRWPRHFSKELRETWEGPFWRYDPDAPPPASTSGEVQKP